MKEIPAQLEGYYDNTIFLKEDSWLSFHRQHYKGHNDVVVVSLVDGLLECTTTLASYVDGNWQFPNQRSASVFWTYAKKYDNRMKRIIRKLVAPIPQDMSFQITWKCFKRKLQIKTRKMRKQLNFIFKH